mmetsp:Transcript_0/g.1  ORF Transcript_0/g.1 Transcript_0/m.1 type:complete len:414 (-) Transcript_0:94-1335(-)
MLALCALTVGMVSSSTAGERLLSSLPAPLKAEDGGFTYDSVQRRLGLIAYTVIENNPSFSDELKGALHNLASEISAGEPVRALGDGASETWRNTLAPHVSAGDTWFSMPWFTVENYFYKRILELTDRETGLADPFSKQKAESLAGAADAFARMCASGLCEGADLLPLISTSLWGNLADLSLSAGAKLVAPELASAGNTETPSNMLADDSAQLCKALLAAQGKKVVLVLDNCGLELVSDLVFVDGLLRISKNGPVVLHVKERPVFVSDVTQEDLSITLDWLDAHGGSALASRLREALAEQRLQVAAPDFYTSALPFWDMPEELRTEMGSAALVICKGDANYRRLLGDLHWPHDLSFQRLMEEYWPTSVAALRTCKSGVLIGVDPAVEAEATAAHPEKWLTGGIYGMISHARVPS